jgi:hypothetical protein
MPMQRIVIHTNREASLINRQTRQYKPDNGKIAAHPKRDGSLLFSSAPIIVCILTSALNVRLFLVTNTGFIVDALTRTHIYAHTYAAP